MKALIALALTLFTTQAAQADTLKCASAKGQNIYYGNEGQLLLVATVLGETLLSNSRLTFTGDSNYGSQDARLGGTINGSGKYVRFSLDGDAWCSFKLTLPRGFQNARAKISAFVDAYCEENTNSSIRMSCKID